MIPKIIHFCWLSGDPYPEKIQTCLDSWKKKLPDYEIWLWDLNRFDINSVTWCKEAFEKKKYAFAADYIRCYALYNYGGIYLDSDVEVIKSYNDLLNLPYFCGLELYERAIEMATFGAEKGFEPFKYIMEYYEKKHFIREDGSLHTDPMPEVVKKALKDKYKYLEINDVKDFVNDKNTICILPKVFFSPGECTTIDKRTFSIHHFAASWFSPKYRMWKRLSEKILGHKLKRFIADLYLRLRYGNSYFDQRF